MLRLDLTVCTPFCVCNSEKPIREQLKTALGSRTPAAVKQRYQKKYPFSSPLTRIYCWGKERLRA